MLACGAAVFTLATTADAGPLAGPFPKALDEATVGLVEPIHGCHRDVLADRWGWHFHRRNCSRVDVAPPDYGPGPYRRYRSYEPCYWVGPVRVCP